MRALRHTLLHGLCGIAGYWFVSSADQAAPPAAAWDVFGDVGPVRGAFVTTVSIITPGGSK